MPTNIKSVRVVFVEGSNEMVDMVQRTFNTHTGWACALAAVRRDAEDYLPGMAYNKMEVVVTNDLGYATYRLDVTAHTVDPFPIENWE